MAKSRTTAFEAGLNALRYRDLSASELRQRLEGKAFTASECADALDALEQAGLLDDRRFAENRALALSGRGAGDAFIRHALEVAGVASEVIEDALAGVPPETSRARAVVDRRGADARTARYLSAKGFSAETVSEVVATILRDE